MGHMGPNQIKNLVENHPLEADMMLLTEQARAAKRDEMATPEWQAAHPEQAKLGSIPVSTEVIPSQE